MVLIVALHVRNNGPRPEKNQALGWYFLSVFSLFSRCKSLVQLLYSPPLKNTTKINLGHSLRRDFSVSHSPTAHYPVRLLITVHGCQVRALWTTFAYTPLSWEFCTNSWFLWSCPELKRDLTNRNVPVYSNWLLAISCFWIIKCSCFN